MNSNYLNFFKQNAQKIITVLNDELKSIRTGRANSSLVENLVVETYGGQTQLKLFELATINSEGPTTLSITPFDPQTIADIEKAILKSPLGISPRLVANRLILTFPPLSQEQREKILKLVNQKVEEKKQQIRNWRDETRKMIKNAFEKKEINEDEKFRLEKEIDNYNQQLTEEIQKIKKKKESEILQL
ncbi:MAG: ribosome-recycling factor [Patescibacteria group bacterium]|nr:ribosome-recycling factor [Patescibacteria group bacterium]